MWIEDRERLELYRFLAGVFNTIPTREFVTKFLDGLDVWEEFGNRVIKSNSGFNESISLITGFLKKHKKESDIEKLKNDLGVDRTRLIGGISKDYGPPPPYESVYRDGEILMGPSTKMVYQEYQRTDIYHAWKLAENPPDYLGLELEYMYFLCQEQLDASCEEVKRKIMGYQKSFIEEHLEKWVPAYCLEIRRWARTDFFKGIGLLLETLIKDDLKYLK